jgi:hypothetical protein
MITVRQIQKSWSAKAYDRLLEQLTAPRAEASDRLLSHMPGPMPAAAMACIRLDELAQSYVPLYSELVRAILNAQQPDGGWGDVMVTAVCLKALMNGQGSGEAIERGLASLASLQKPEGIWPSMPVRRMPADAFASAFVLSQLGDKQAFRDAVRFNDAVQWFAANELGLDEETRKLYRRSAARTATVRSAPRKARPNAAEAPSNLSFWNFTAALGLAAE